MERSRSSQGPKGAAAALPFELIDWPRRLARERDLIERLLTDAPAPRAIDLGCGSGHHARFLAERGFEVVGIDGSEAALDAAQEEPIPDGVQFILGDIGAVERTVRGHFGAAFCLGNTLPQLLSAESVSRLLIGLKRRLLPGAAGRSRAGILQLDHQSLLRELMFSQMHSSLIAKGLI